MVWAAIGAAAVGVVGGAIVSNSRGSGGSAQAGSNSPSAAADPFMSQRGIYQPTLNQLMETGVGKSGDQASQNSMTAIANGIGSGSNQALDSMNALLTGGQFNLSQDPGYQFRLQQGTETVKRGAAASGQLDSGGMMAALQDYGQGQASQEYQAAFSRAQSGVATNMAAEQQQFNQYQTIDQNSQNIFSNNYQRLAQLSGATIGSPSSAGQLMQTQQAQSAAQMQQYGGLAVQGGQALWNWASGGSGGSPMPANNTANDYSLSPVYQDPNASGALTNVNW